MCSEYSLHVGCRLASRFLLSSLIHSKKHTSKGGSGFYIFIFACDCGRRQRMLVREFHNWLAQLQLWSQPCASCPMFLQFLPVKLLFTEQPDATLAYPATLITLPVCCRCRQWCSCCLLIVSWLLMLGSSSPHSLPLSNPVVCRFLSRPVKRLRLHRFIFTASCYRRCLRLDSR